MVWSLIKITVSLLYIVYKTRTLAVRSTTYCGRIITANMYIACKMLEESTSLFTCYLFNSFRAWLATKAQILQSTLAWISMGWGLYWPCVACWKVDYRSSPVVDWPQWKLDLAPFKRCLSKMEQNLSEKCYFFGSQSCHANSSNTAWGLKWHGLLWQSVTLQSGVQPPLDGGKVGCYHSLLGIQVW